MPQGLFPGTLKLLPQKLDFACRPHEDTVLGWNDNMISDTGNFASYNIS